MYDVKSKKAEEFISDEEILDTLEYAKKNKDNRELVDSILEKASLMKGITHREAAVLLEEPPHAVRTPAAATTPAAARKLRREIIFFIVNILLRSIRASV